jgi:hypothetical protein
MKQNKGSLSGGKLFNVLRDDFSKIPDSRIQELVKIPLVDALMSGLAVFAIKYESLLQFEEERSRIENGETLSNLKSLFGVKNIPSDTQMREILDPVDPLQVRGSFKNLFDKIQRLKYLKPFEFHIRNGQPYYLMPVDATGYFSSHKVHCSNCLQKVNKKTGEVTYHHQMLAAAIVHPNLSTVIPLTPEPISQQDGIEKNDCELNAFKRLIPTFRMEHPQLKVIVTTDGLYSVGPAIELLEAHGMSYMLGVKPDNHEALFREVDGAEKMGNVRHFEYSEEIGDKVKKTVTHKFRYKENVSLNNKYSLKQGINFLEYWETTEWYGKRGFEKEEKHFSWVIDFKIRKDEHFQKFTTGGRARWKIENETFNTLKNQGYNFEHNYGHGYKNLSVIFGFLMMLSFFTDQIQQMGCKKFQSLLEIIRRSYLWREIRSLYKIYYFKSWSELLDAAFQINSGIKKRVRWNTS